MTNKAALATVEALLTAGAEPAAEILANRTVDDSAYTAGPPCITLSDAWPRR